jgi:hypothetical protein
MDGTKIRLSAAEIELVSNTDMILTKNRILDKVKQLLGDVQLTYAQQLLSASFLPTEVQLSSAKISRGENYKGLPWLVLDYPRCFGQKDVFAVRTMFWWGQFFSITLQLSGSYKTAVEETLYQSYETLRDEGFFFCINESPWHHHFEKNNLLPLAEVNRPLFEEGIKEKPFVKLAVKFPLQNWDVITDRLTEKFTTIMKLFTC